MRLEAITTPSGVVLKFSKDGVARSMAIETGMVKKLSIDDGIAYVSKKLLEMLPPAPPVSAEVFEVDDEDDEDISLYEEEVVVDGYTPREYLEGIGVI